MAKAVKTKKTERTAKPAATKKVAKVVESGNVGLKLKVFDMTGKELSQTELAEQVFATQVNRNLLAQYVRVYQNNQRQGNASTKTRSEVSGTTKKVYRQKGTGRARHGASKGPTFVGGGVTFGPLPRNFSLKMNKQQLRQALASALTLKAKANALVGLSDDAQKMEAKTKIFATWLKGVGLNDKKILIIADKPSDNFMRAVRNLDRVDVALTTNLNPHSVLNHAQVVFTEQALKVVTDRLS